MVTDLKFIRGPFVYFKQASARSAFSHAYVLRAEWAFYVYVDTAG